MKKGNPKAIYLKDYQAPEYLIKQVNLRFELGEQCTKVYAELNVELNTAAVTHSGTLKLSGEQLKLIALSIDGVELNQDQYRLTEDGLSIANVPEKFCLASVVEIDPANNTALEGLYLSSNNFCTQCEAEGFRKITYYLDRPDVLAEFKVRIEADAKRYPMLLSNGNRVNSGSLEDGRHFVEWHDPFPKPSYLFALVAGDLVCSRDTYTTKSGRKVNLEVYTEAHNASKCGHALASLQKAMQWDEDTFDLEYDLEAYMIVAVDDFNMGAMENKGLNVFNSKYVLASPETATDFDYMGIEAVIAHEYFHNWTGNRVTCRDWFQLSLKEGLTVFRDQEFTSDVTSRAVKRIQDVRNLRTYQFAEDAGPMAHPVRPASFVEINNFYTLTVYEKGAEVVRMYQTLFGKDGFRKGLQNYLQKFDGQAVTTDDFLAAMQEANNYDLDNFVYWYSQAGTPTLTVDTHWQEDSAQYIMNINQEHVASANEQGVVPLLVPVTVSLLDKQGNALPLSWQDQHKVTSCTLHVKQASQQFVFDDITECPVPSLLQDFSAPVKLNYDYTDDDYTFLMSNDVDMFNRWEAGQQFAQKWLLKSITDIQTQQPLDSIDKFTQALSAVLKDKTLENAFQAEMLVMPSESFLAECINPVDVDAIFSARRALQKIIAAKLETSLFEKCQQQAKIKKYSYNAVDMGTRCLASISLMYLCLLEKNEYIEFAKRQYEQANNMTDKMAVLEAVNDLEGDYRHEVMRAFAQEWKSEPLVMNKWFSLQARARHSNALQTVIKLLEHECFSIKNPNNVYSLIGAFANSNPTAFHANDGSGYAFLKEQVIRLNAINPQVAARMVKPLIHWKKYDDHRQSLMQKYLQEIIATENLSSDVYELVDRSLNPINKSS